MATLVTVLRDLCVLREEKRSKTLSAGLPKASRIPGSWVLPELGMDCSMSDGR